jgi:hypothetical protein
MKQDSGYLQKGTRHGEPNCEVVWRLTGDIRLYNSNDGSGDDWFLFDESLGSITKNDYKYHYNTGCVTVLGDRNNLDFT